MIREYPQWEAPFLVGVIFGTFIGAGIAAWVIRFAPPVKIVRVPTKKG